MDIAQLKLSLMERLMLVWDEAALKRLEKAIDSEVPAEDDDMTDEEYAELERRRADRLSGKATSITAEESIRRLRAASKG